MSNNLPPYGISSQPTTCTASDQKAQDPTPSLTGANLLRFLDEKDDESLKHLVWFKPDTTGENNRGKKTAGQEFKAEDAFFCHRGPDTKHCIVIPLARTLGSLYKYRCFVDCEPHNVRYRSKAVDKTDILRQSIWTCPIIIVFLSPRFHESEWCLRELYTAYYRKLLEPDLILHMVYCGIAPDECNKHQAFAELDLGRAYGTLKQEKLTNEQFGSEILHPTLYQMIHGTAEDQKSDKLFRTLWKLSKRRRRKNRLFGLAFFLLCLMGVSSVIHWLRTQSGPSERTMSPTISPVPTASPTIAPITWQEIAVIQAPNSSILFGISTACSNDASTILVGSTGSPYVLRRNETGGYSIEPEESWGFKDPSIGSDYGAILDISANGHFAAVADPSWKRTPVNSGTLDVRYFDGRRWRTLGWPTTLQFGPTSFDEFLHGSYISVSKDTATVVAIGNEDEEVVETLFLQGDTWEVGPKIVPPAELEGSFGWSVDLNADGSALIVGAPESFAALDGHVAVYDWNGTAWGQRGNIIRGEVPDARCGYDVKISSDGTVIAFSENFSFQGGHLAGRVRVFKWNGLDWVTLGNGLTGNREDGDLEFGRVLSMNKDGSRIVLGNPFGFGAGSVHAYSWTGREWLLRGERIENSKQRGELGRAVSICGDGNIVVASDPSFGEPSAGVVRVYEAQ